MMGKGHTRGQGAGTGDLRGGGGCAGRGVGERGRRAKRMFPKLNIRRKGSLASSAVIRAPRNQALRRCLPLSAAVVLAGLSHLVTYCHDCLRKWNGASGRGEEAEGGGVLFRRGLEMDGRRSSPASLEGNPGGERVGERVVDGNKCVVAAYVCWLVGTFLPCAGPAVSGGHCYRDRLNIRQPPHLYGCSGPRITLPGFKAREKQWSYPHPPHFPLSPPPSAGLLHDQGA